MSDKEKGKGKKPLQASKLANALHAILTEKTVRGLSDKLYDKRKNAALEIQRCDQRATHALPTRARAVRKGCAAHAHVRLGAVRKRCAEDQRDSQTLRAEDQRDSQTLRAKVGEAG